MSYTLHAAGRGWALDAEGGALDTVPPYLGAAVLDELEQLQERGQPAAYTPTGPFYDPDPRNPLALVAALRAVLPRLDLEPVAVLEAVGVALPNVSLPKGVLA